MVRESIVHSLTVIWGFLLMSYMELGGLYMGKWLHYKLSDDFLSSILHRFFFLLTKLSEMEAFSLTSGLRDKI